MRYGWRTGLLVALVGGLLAGCGSTHSGSGGSTVSITGEDLQTVLGNLCAMEGNATNVGNITVHVVISYQALSATGAVIGTSTASFDIAPFSNFNFQNSRLNSSGQPSSSVFTNGLACAGISNFKRTNVDVTNA